MRRWGIFVFAVMATALVAVSQVPGKKVTLPVDEKASVLRWTGHAEVGSYAPSGTLRLKEGSLTFEAGRFAGARLLIQMDSLEQENADLAHHLKSEDFFDVAHYPTATIQIDRLISGQAYGSLMIRGKTTPVEIPVQVSQAGEHFQVAGKVTLDRTKYGITYNSTNFFSGLGNKAIRNSFEVEFVVVGSGVIPQGYR